MRRSEASEPATHARGVSGEGTAAEHHYSVAEVAEMWGVSPDFVRRLFEREPGVLVLGNRKGGRGKRRYRTLRFPASVVERVYRRHLSVAA